MAKHRIRIDRKTGQVEAIYDDALLPYANQVLQNLGLSQDAMSVSRASNVEPARGNEAGGNWSVDLTPVGGPTRVLCDESDRPFLTHEDALAYERRWIEAHRLGTTNRPAITGKGVPHVGSVS